MTITIGDKIRNYRKLSGLTQKQLGELSGTSETTIKQYEAGKRQPRIEQLIKIADTLNVLSSDLLPEGPIDGLHSGHLVEALKWIGCRIAWDEDNAMTWIETPEGTLEVTENDLLELEKSTSSYLQFKIEELKKRHPEDFRPKKKR